MVAYKKGTKGYKLQEKRKKETMLKKYGGEKGKSEFYAKIGRKGGKNGTTGGFYANTELAKRAGKVGGQKSRRPQNYNYGIYRQSDGRIIKGFYNKDEALEYYNGLERDNIEFRERKGA